MEAIIFAVLVFSAALGHDWARAIAHLRWPELPEALKRLGALDPDFVRAYPDFPIIDRGAWAWESGTWAIRVDGHGVLVRHYPKGGQASEFFAPWGAAWPEEVRISLGDIAPEHAAAMDSFGRSVQRWGGRLWFLPGAHEVELVAAAMVKAARR